MASASPHRTYRLIVGILAGLIIVTLILVGLTLILNRPPSSRAVAATLTAAPGPAYTATPVPTAVPTLAGVSPELLVCQRQAGQAMIARQMVGAVNLSDDRLLRLKWVSLDWPVSDLDSGLSGVIMGLDVALNVWEEACNVYDRVQIEIYDRQGAEQTHKLTVHAQMDDALKWRAGELDDRELLARLEVTRAGEVP
jgi:hypothetical protein